MGVGTLFFSVVSQNVTKGIVAGHLIIRVSIRRTFCLNCTSVCVAWR